MVPQNRFSCVAILPVGPKSVPEFTLDTVNSIIKHSAPTKIVLLDDTIAGFSEHCGNVAEHIDIIRCQNDGSYSSYGRLYKNVSRAIEHALDNYDFDIVLRIDDDALVLSNGSEAGAILKFRGNPRIGMLVCCPINNLF